MRLLRPAHPAHLVTGLALWCVWFVVVYGGLSVACGIDAPPPQYGALNWINYGIALTTLATLVLLTVLALACWRARANATGRARFIVTSSAGLYVTAWVATLATGLPAIFLPPCV